MRHAAHEAECFEQLLIQRAQGLRIFRLARQGARHEDAAAVHHIERRFGVAVHFGKDHFFFRDDRIDVEDVAGNVLLQHVIRLPIAQRVDGGPEFIGRVDLLDPERGRFRARLQHPRRRARAT